jgi:hypothetical protein
LDREYNKSLEKHDQTIYIALGSHVILPREDATKIVLGLIEAMDKGIMNGVIWAVGLPGRKDFDRKLVLTVGGKETTFGALLDGMHGGWMFPTFAPQRGALEHPITKVYFTHGDGSSANEGLFHEKPMKAMGIFFGGILNSAKLAATGSSLSLDRFTLTSLELFSRVQLLIEGKEGEFKRNCAIGGEEEGIGSGFD